MADLALSDDFSQKRVVAAVSGGVDSAVALCLLQEAGACVCAATMSLYDGKIALPSSADGVRNSCYGPDEKIDVSAAKSLCKRLGIRHETIALCDEYADFVLANFRAEYRCGRTPNPCVRCNENVKLGAFVEKCEKIFGGFDYFVTGHYARIFFGCANFFQKCGYDEETARKLAEMKIPLIKKARDEKKDQSYFLYRVKTEILRKTRFPLGEFEKSEIVGYAREKKLAAAQRKESQDFIPKEYFPQIFARGENEKSGNFVDLNGTVLGRHFGIENYTIGQRRGLGISAPNPLYVATIDAKKNEVVLAERESLFKKSVEVSNWHWSACQIPQNNFRAKVKIRAASLPADAQVILEKNRATVANATENSEICCKIIFDDGQFAVAPGQSAVAYVDDVVIGGGIIERAE